MNIMVYSNRNITNQLFRPQLAALVFVGILGRYGAQQSADILVIFEIFR
jgi:hypothetical protein